MTEMLSRQETGLNVGPLRNLLDGDVVAPGESDWDEARLAWNLAVDQQPAAVVLAESAADVAATVAFAKAHALRVAPQGTGHGAAAMGDMSDTILLKTERMRGVTIDPEQRIARAEAGTIWIEVVEAAAEHGLAALAGSSPDVGVVGYTLGGGLSLVRAQARHRRQPGAPRSRSSRPPATSSAPTGRTSPISSGRCAAAAAPSGS